MDLDVIGNFLWRVVVIMAPIYSSVQGEKMKGNITRGPSYEHPLRTSDLMCYFCINEDKSDNCMTMANTSKIQVLRCKQKETFCKVRRFETKGVLTTFDRHCAEYCTPGCEHSIINNECISCCSTSLCNTDNGTDNDRAPAALIIIQSLLAVLLWTSNKA